MIKIFFLLSIILAVSGLAAGVMGLILDQRSWRSEKLDGTYSSQSNLPEASINDPGHRQILYKEFRKEKIKGIQGSFSFNYKIPEFFSRLRSGDKTVKIHALILLGFTVFVLFTFLSIGIGLVNWGETGGWFFIGVVLLVFIVLVVVYWGHYARSKKSSR